MRILLWLSFSYHYMKRKKCCDRRNTFFWKQILEMIFKKCESAYVSRAVNIGNTEKYICISLRRISNSLMS